MLIIIANSQTEGSFYKILHVIQTSNSTIKVQCRPGKGKEIEVLITASTHTHSSFLLFLILFWQY
jgi:hypothetical protein